MKLIEVRDKANQKMAKIGEGLEKKIHEKKIPERFNSAGQKAKGYSQNVYQKLQKKFTKKGSESLESEGKEN